MHVCRPQAPTPLCPLHTQGRAALQDFHQQRLPPQMLDENDRRWKLRRQLRKQVPGRSDTPRRGGEEHYVVRG